LRHRSVGVRRGAFGSIADVTAVEAALDANDAVRARQIWRSESHARERRLSCGADAVRWTGHRPRAPRRPRGVLRPPL